MNCYIDGSCIDNPSMVGSWGFLITDPWIEENGILRGERITNNLAEYTALYELLKRLQKYEWKRNNIYSDSKLVVNIVNKQWGMKKGLWNPHKKYPELRQLAIASEQLLCEGGHTLKWIPREQNHLADEIADKAYNEIEHSPNH